jgi:hypothetical protein
MPGVLRVIKAFFPAVVLTYVIASVLATQIVLASVSAAGLEVGLADRIGATFHDLIGLASSYLVLITIALVLGLPVAAGIVHLQNGRFRVAWFALAGFVALLALHLIMKQVLGVTGIAAARTLPGLLSQAAAGALGGCCYALLSRRPD